jgi:hypothetical protein
MCQSIEKLGSVKMWVAKVYTRSEIGRAASSNNPCFCATVPKSLPEKKK